MNMASLRNKLLGTVVLLNTVLWSFIPLSHAGAITMLANEKLAIDKNGIKVWTYQIPNNPAFNYRATTIVDSSLTNVLSLIVDTAYLTQWVPYVSQVDVLERDDRQGTFLIRMEMDFPFPLQDRDVVVKGKISQASDGTVTIKNQLASDSRAPVKPKVVRITRYEGEWKLKPLAGNKVSVTTIGYADPAGLIPLSVTNRFTQQQPYDMLIKMKEQLKQPKYKIATIGGVTESVTVK